MDNSMDFATFLLLKRIEIARDFFIFASDNNGTVVLLWQDRQA